MSTDNPLAMPRFAPQRSRQNSICLHNKSGVALILVLAALSIIAVVLIGFTLAMQLEKQASESSFVSLQSDAIVQASLSHATALLAQNIPPVANGTSVQSLLNTSATNWWVNPGLLSTQLSGSASTTLIPLYTTPNKMTTYPPSDTPPSTVDAPGNPAQGIDLNRPLLYNNSVYTITGKAPATIDADHPDNSKPMPVYWQYVAQNPSIPHQSDPSKPSYNPYIGRYGFWMEPENSKIDFTTALGKKSTVPPDAALITSGAPDYSQCKFDVNVTSAKVPTTFTLGNPCTVDLSVLSGATATTNPLDLSKLFNAQQYILRGNAGTGTYGTGPAYNSLPISGDTTIPATLDDVEQIKNFVSTGNPDTFYENNKFYLTNYSRDPEFNVFGGSRLYPNNYANGTSWYDTYDLHPTHQYFWNVNEPTWFDGAGVESVSGKLGGGQGRTYGGILYLSKMMQRTDWPGYQAQSIASKWSTVNPQREADQVAWNLYGMATRFQDQINGSPNDLGGCQGKFFLFHQDQNNPNLNTIDVPNCSPAMQYIQPYIQAQYRVPLGATLWSGTVASSRYSAQGCPLVVDEVGFQIRAFPTTADPSKYNLRFTFKAEFHVPAGFSQDKFPLYINNSATTVVVSHLEYSTDGTNIITVSPKVLFSPLSDVNSENAPFPWDYNFNSIPKALSAFTTTPYIGPNDYISVTNGTDDDPLKTQEYIDPTTYSGQITVSKLKIKFAVYTQFAGVPIQTTPLRSRPSSAGINVTYASMEPESGSAPALINFNGVNWVLAGAGDQTTFKSMELDDPRLAINADVATTGLKGGWRPAGGDNSFNAPNTSANGADQSKVALTPLGTGSNYYLDPSYNDYSYVSPGLLFYACTGMQSGTPWKTLSLQPGGGNLSGGTQVPITSSAQRQTSAPPDYLLLDLLQAPYRYGNMSSSVGKININSVVYPSYFGVTRLLPLEALLVNTNVSGKSINLGTVGALVGKIQAMEKALQGFRYAGELCEVPDLNLNGASATEFQKEGLMRNLSGLITTRSNSFGIWGAAQTIKEQSDGSVVVRSDKRFHAIIERYVWPGNDGLYGNAYVDSSGTYSKSPKHIPGNPLDNLDGPDAIPAQSLPNGIPLNLNLPVANPEVPNPSSQINYTKCDLEQASNPLSPYMKYRVVNFRYLTD